MNDTTANTTPDLSIDTPIEPDLSIDTPIEPDPSTSPSRSAIDELKECPYLTNPDLPQEVIEEYFAWYENHRRAVEEYQVLKDPENTFLLSLKTQDPVPTARQILEYPTINEGILRALERYKKWVKEIRKLADDLDPDTRRKSALDALKLAPVMTFEELEKQYRTHQTTTMEYLKWVKQLVNLYNQWVAVKEPPPPKPNFNAVDDALELIARRVTFKGFPLEFKPKGSKPYTKPKDAKVVPLSTLKALADNPTEFANLEKILAQFPYTIWRDPNKRPNSTVDYNILIFHNDGILYLRTYSKE